MAFTYDKTYQLTAEFGRYASNFMPFMSFMVSNQFAYDPAGNRILSVGAASAPRYYSHTSDNQLTGIYWNTDKLTLGGILQDCWTAHWVKVKQSTSATWVPAQLKLRKGQDVAWVSTNVPLSGTGTLSFDIQAQITNNYVVTQTVSYTHSSNLPSFQSSIAYTYDANGNRTEKWTNGLFAARYFYDTDNQLLGISFNNDQDCTDSGDYAYAYDPFGRRISATEDGVTRHFAYDGLDCIAELDSNANVKKCYLRGNGLGGGIGDVIAGVSPTETNYFCYNHRGDVVTLTRPDGQVSNRFEYSAFGAPIIPAPAARGLMFSSKEYDTRSGLSYYGFRYYDAASGRWLTKDPYFVVDINGLYGFCLNNPVYELDYYGLLSPMKNCRVYLISGHFTYIDPQIRALSEADYPEMTRVGTVSCWSGRTYAHIPSSNRIQDSGLPKPTADKEAGMIGGKGWNDGRGPGSANYKALLKAALEAAKREAYNLAADCKCQCSAIDVYLRCQKPNEPPGSKGGANFATKQRVFEGKCNNVVETYPCRSNAKP